jgi:hypothetical protein
MHDHVVVEVVQLERKMRGGCQSALVLGADGNRYILKCFGNPQGSHTLFHEALGSQLARVLNLPVPNWHPLYLSPDFIKAHPDLAFSLSGHERTQPSAGLHFGSAFVDAEGSGEVYEVIPSSWFNRISNREDFVGMLLLDRWTDHLDRRQALFRRNADSDALEAIFIDHGQMFGDHHSPLRSRRGRARFLDARIYKDWCREAALQVWYEGIVNVDEAILDDLMGTIPSEWISIFHAANVVRTLLEGKAALMDDIATLRSDLAEVAP